jgi:hypothetical protein
MPRLICPLKGGECSIPNLCDVANAPLRGAVTNVTSHAIGRGRRKEYAEAELYQSLCHTGDTMGADFSPLIDYPDAIICPVDVLDSNNLPKGLTIEQVAAGVGLIAAKCVDGVIRKINVEEAQHGRS